MEHIASPKTLSVQYLCPAAPASWDAFFIAPLGKYPTRSSRTSCHITNPMETFSNSIYSLNSWQPGKSFICFPPPLLSCDSVCYEHQLNLSLRASKTQYKVLTQLQIALFVWQWPFWEWLYSLSDHPPSRKFKQEELDFFNHRSSWSVSSSN